MSYAITYLDGSAGTVEPMQVQSVTALPSALLPAGVAAGALIVAGGKRYEVRGVAATIDAAIAAARAATATAPGLLSARDFDLVNDRAYYVRHHEDFLCGVTGTLFASVVSGAAAAVGQGGPEVSVCGVASMTTGTTAAGRAAAAYNGGAPFRFGDGSVQIDMRVKVPTLADVAEDFEVSAGLMNSGGATADATVGVWFAYERSVSGNWRARSNRTAAQTDTDTGVPVATSWVHLRIIVNADRTSAAYYIGGALVATVATTLPASGDALGAVAGIFKLAGTTARTFLIDSIAITKAFSAPRVNG